MNKVGEKFEENFGYESFIPLFIFILGLYIMYLILKEDYPQAFFVMLLAFIVYIVNNVVMNIKGFNSVFNDILEDLAIFLTFGITTILFGIIFYKGDVLIMLILIFYSICFLLSIARSWSLHSKNSLGFPIVLNGLFFPLVYYIFRFYLHEPGDSIFLIYYLIVAVLSISKSNFIGFQDEIEDSIRILNEKKISNNEIEKEDDKILELIKKRDKNNLKIDNNNNNINNNINNNLKEEINSKIKLKNKMKDLFSKYKKKVINKKVIKSENKIEDINNLKTNLNNDDKEKII